MYHMTEISIFSAVVRLDSSIRSFAAACGCECDSAIRFTLAIVTYTRRLQFYATIK